MLTRSFIAIALASAALACGDSKPPAARPAAPASPVQAMIAERLRTDLRPDSFTAAADRGRMLGDSAAPVWVVMVSDFQCADCKQWHDEVYPLIRKEYVATGRIRLAYLNRPLERHLNGMATAIAAACASVQGKFWETHDRIFATVDRWRDLPDARPYLDSLAIDAGADARTLRLCTERAQSMKLVRTDRERTTAAGVDSLPTFFIGAHTLRGAVRAATFRAVIDSALAGK